MKKWKVWVAGLSLSLMQCLAHSQPLELLWETEAVFKTPESIIYDPQRKQFYVSNIDGEVNTPDGKGYISVVSDSGKVQSKVWVDGLNAPKGLGLFGDALYVADINRLVVIDLKQAQVILEYVAEDAKFLNDVAVDSTGVVYVSDMSSNAIYRLQDGVFDRWIEDARLEMPNGLCVDGDHLIVASWGNMTNGFETDVPGHLKVISLETGSMESLGSGQPLGNLDGIEPDGSGGYFLTDWMLGTVLHADKNGHAQKLLTLHQGTADLTVVLDQGLLLIPMMQDNTVKAYRLP